MSRKEQLIKYRGAQICTSLTWIGLNDSNNSWAQLWCESPFFCKYYSSKWFQKHIMYNWFVKEKKFGAATSLEQQLFRGDFLKELILLFHKSLLLLLTIVNSDGLYLADGFLRNLYPCSDIVFVQLRCITRTRNKFVEIVPASERYLIIISGINETAVHYDMLFRKICWWKNVEIASSHLIYNIVSLSNMAGKIKSLSGKVSWIWTSSEISRNN